MAKVLCTGILLAGGQSQRMGRDKALLLHNGVTLLAHGQALLRDAGAEALLISRNEAGFITDIWTNRGPLAGLHACLSAIAMTASADAIALVLPIDMPMLTAARLRVLWQSLANSPSANAAYYAGYNLPCAIRISTGLVTQLNHQLANAEGDHSLTFLLRSLSAIALPISASAEFDNINTPAEFARLSSKDADNLPPTHRL